MLGQHVENPARAHSDDLLMQMQLDQLQRGQFQPRSKFDGSKLDELTRSIASQGVIQPLVVRKVTENTFEIIVGSSEIKVSKEYREVCRGTVLYSKLKHFLKPWHDILVIC